MRRGPRELSVAELIDLAQQLFNPAADLFALGVQRLDLLGKTRHLAAGLGCLLESRLLLLPEPDHELDRLLDAILKRTERIGFLFHRAHQPPCPRAARAFSASRRNPASSCMATSARILRSRSIPAAFNPCMNLL